VLTGQQPFFIRRKPLLTSQRSNFKPVTGVLTSQQGLLWYEKSALAGQHARFQCKTALLANQEALPQLEMPLPTSRRRLIKPAETSPNGHFTGNEVLRDKSRRPFASYTMPRNKSWRPFRQ
jgi:hypothetical protein